MQRNLNPYNTKLRKTQTPANTLADMEIETMRA